MIDVDAWIRAEAPPARLTMQVHDELILEVADERLEDVADAVRARMTQAASLDVPLVAEIGDGANWAAAH